MGQGVISKQGGRETSYLEVAFEQRLERAKPVDQVD